MPLTLSPDSEALIRRMVEAGLYRSADEAIEEAVRLLDARDHQLAPLRAKLRLGLESGQGIELTPDLMDEIERESEAAARRSKPPSPEVCP